MGQDGDELSSEGRLSSHDEGLCAKDALPLSKNQQKKRRKAEYFERQKPIRRQSEKERRKLRNEKARQAGTYVAPRQKVAPADRQAVQATLVIDLGFDALMTDKEICSMTAQLSLLYSANRLARSPFARVVMCGQGTCDPRSLIGCEEERQKTKKQDEELPLFDSRLGRRMETTMQACWRRWESVIVQNNGGLAALQGTQDTAGDDGNALPHAPFADQKPLAFPLQKIVYLTADTQTTLDRIEDDCAYVIGGLVDRNRHKNICAEKARKLGLQTARLPISSERLRTSSVLTVNQVVEILLSFNETNDWDMALDRHLPHRKQRQQQQKQPRPGNSEDDGDHIDRDLDLAGRLHLDG